MTHAPTSANIAPDKRVGEMLYADYEGTRLGRQELAGESCLTLRTHCGQLEPLTATATYIARSERDLTVMPWIVAVDPQAQSTGAETGIVVAGKISHWKNDSRPHAFVFGDESISGTPDVWATKAVTVRTTTTVLTTSSPRRTRAATWSNTPFTAVDNTRSC